jgi:thiamine biosynthesis lipoprotein
VTEHRETFPCFGAECTVIVSGPGATEAVENAKHRLLEWHHQLSRFEADSELSRMNADPRRSVPVSPILRRVVQAAIDAAERTDGLVDPTLVREIEEAGYDAHHEASSALDLDEALALAPPRSPAGGDHNAGWRAVEVDRRSGTITRPPGIEIDAGGIAKGVFADELATVLAPHDAYAVDCAGDIRLGGRSRLARPLHVASPFADETLHSFELVAGAAATSGIGKRSWLDAHGRAAHHLLDPATGRPAFTGVVQATALAPTATEAEALSKAALLSGPAEAERWLPHGGVVVLEDGDYWVVTDAGARASSHATMSSSTRSCSGSLRIS